MACQELSTKSPPFVRPEKKRNLDSKCTEMYNVCLDQVRYIEHIKISDYPDDAESLSPSTTATGVLVLTGSVKMIG